MNSEKEKKDEREGVCSWSFSVYHHHTYVSLSVSSVIIISSEGRVAGWGAGGEDLLVFIYVKIVSCLVYVFVRITLSGFDAIYPLILRPPTAFGFVGVWLFGFACVRGEFYGLGLPSFEDARGFCLALLAYPYYFAGVGSEISIPLSFLYLDVSLQNLHESCLFLIQVASVSLVASHTHFEVERVGGGWCRDGIFRVVARKVWK